jgi:hypothetical protein
MVDNMYLGDSPVYSVSVNSFGYFIPFPYYHKKTHPATGKIVLQQFNRPQHPCRLPCLSACPGVTRFVFRIRFEVIAKSCGYLYPDGF